MTRSQREVIEIIRRLGEPLTRAAYIGVIWNHEPPADWDAEEEADMPRFLQGAPDGQTFDCARALAGEYDRLDDGDARKWLVLTACLRLWRAIGGAMSAGSSG